MKRKKHNHPMDIYLDNAATTKPCASALNAAAEASLIYANPSSSHRAGLAAAALLKDARHTLAKACGCRDSEIYFTSSGTESNCLALTGLARADIRRSKRIISTGSEHPSVENTLKALEAEGFEVFRLSTKGGAPDYAALEALLGEKTSLVAVMHVNNETGAIYDIARIRKLIDASGSGARLFSDNVQGFLKEKSITQYCDVMSASAHKIHGLKGSALLMVREGTRIKPIIYGGEQEKGLRPGTENLPGICAFAAAAKAMSNDREKIDRLYAQLCDGLKKLPYCTLNIPAEASPFILNVSLGIIGSEVALNALSSMGIYISAGSACSTHRRDTRVPEAFGLSGKALSSAVRISISHETCEDDIARFLDGVAEVAGKYGKL